MNLAARPTMDLCVLVLEDDPFQREYVTNMIRSIGVRRILPVADGGLGIDTIAQASCGVDVAVCDLQLDDMDGVEFISRAFRLGVKDFIIMSSLGEDLLASVARMAGRCGARVLGCLPKPVQPTALSAMLAAATLERSAPKPAAHEVQFDTEDLVTGLQGGQFVAYFQPKVRFDNGTVSGAEALARWNHPVLGLVSPARFIPQMEAAGLLDLLTVRMFDQAFEFQSACAGHGFDIGVAVNSSPSNLQDAAFPGLLAAQARRHGVDPDRVTIEVTETAVAGDGIAMMETLSRLRIRGFNLSIDDFGTGYATLELLHQMPFTELKVDRSFVRGALGSARTRTIVGSILEMARGMHLQTVAEGFEEEAESRMLRDLGCDLGQGYYIAKPMPASDFHGWMAIRDRARYSLAA